MKRYTEQVFTRLSKKDKREMNRLAKKNEQTPSEWIRASIKMRLAAIKQFQ